MQIEKNQGKINFHIVRANFRKNLHLCVLLNFKHFTRIYIRDCSIFLFHFLNSLLAFSLPLHCEFENGFDRVFTFVM